MRQDIALLTQTADFVIKYGFLAVGLVLIFLVAPAIYKLAGATRLALVTVSFGLAFVIAYGVLGIVKVVAPQWISGQRVMISGVVLGVPNGRQVQMASDLRVPGHAYTKREFDRERPNVFNFPFLLVTQYAPSCLAVALENVDKNVNADSRAQLFDITPVSADDMEPNIEILAEVTEEQTRTVLKVWREDNGKQTSKATIFQPLGDVDPGCVTARDRLTEGWSIFTRAFAQSAVSDTDFVERLQSDDVFTRRAASITLSKRGEDAFELIGKLLSRDDDYRLQLGAVVALAGMPEDQRKKAPAGLIEKLRPLRYSPDKTVRDTAALLLQEPAICYQEEDTRKESAMRFLAMCYWTKDQCERTRGPNKSPGVTQSNCEPVQLTGLSWRYSVGWEKGWYQYSPSAFGPPFPAIQPRQ